MTKHITPEKNITYSCVLTNNDSTLLMLAWKTILIHNMTALKSILDSMKLKYSHISIIYTEWLSVDTGCRKAKLKWTFYLIILWHWISITVVEKIFLLVLTNNFFLLFKSKICKIGSNVSLGIFKPYRINNFDQYVHNSCTYNCFYVFQWGRK